MTSGTDSRVEARPVRRTRRRRRAVLALLALSGLMVVYRALQQTQAR